MELILELPRIIQTAAEAKNPAAQVRLIVDSIQREMNVDVCSLYLAGDNNDMVLVASHGLGDQAIGRTRLRASEGLIGLVARSRHPVNLVDPAQHPEFRFFEGIGEEDFRSFSAAPLVRGGDIVGVLAVQCREPRPLSSEEEAFLVTLAAQLALVVAHWSDWKAADDPAPPVVIRGVTGAPGVGIGIVRRCDDFDLFAVVDGACTDTEAAVAEWRKLLRGVQAEVSDEKDMLGEYLSGEVAAIFDAYQMLLADPSLVSGVEREIAGGRDLPSALKSVVQHFAELFMAMDDPYLRTRHEDIRHLGNRLYSAWRGERDAAPVDIEGEPLVLVGNQVGVSDIASLPRERLAGMVSLEGSIMSHASILASALGIPAVLGIGRGRPINQGERIIVDANAGQVLVNASAAVEQEYLRVAREEHVLSGRLAHLRDKPAVMRDGERVNLLVNSGLLADLSPGLDAGAEGIGLYRTEIPFMVRAGFPSEEEQLQLYRNVIDTYRGKPVYMRVLDVGGDKPLPYFPIREENPALGWRGIRFCLDNASLLMTQVRAMLRADAGGDCLRILLPMVSATSELVRFGGILDDAVKQLRAEGLDVARPPVGAMVEVPAAISQLALWRAHIDFISIGSNDLSQYLLAVDRNNPRVAGAYDHLNPAVVREVQRIAESARALELPVSVCGEMSSDPTAVVLLLGMGIRTLSMNAARLPRIKWLVCRLDADLARDRLETALAAADSAQMRRELQAFLGEIGYPGTADKPADDTGHTDM